jgi:hypothetical protein
MLEIEKEISLDKVVNSVVDRKFYALFASGVLFWGGAQFFLQRELSNIDKALDKLDQITAEVALIKFRQDRAEQFDSILVQEINNRKDKVDSRFRELETKLLTRPGYEGPRR